MGHVSEGNKLIPPLRNLNGLDLVKFIMAIFVVSIHTNPVADCTNSILNDSFDILTSCAVPFFFLCSGYLLARKFSEPYCNPDNQKITATYLKKILKMYLLWTLVYFPMAVYKYRIENYTPAYSFLITVRKLVFRGENYNSWMLWYLLSTVYILLLILVTMKLKCKKRSLLIVSFTTFFLQIFINTLAWSSTSFTGVLLTVKKIIELTITDGRLFGGFIYLPLGICLYQKDTVMKYAKFLFIPALIGIFFCKNDFLCSLLDTVKNLGLFGLSLSLNLKDNKIYKLLRRSGMIIYFIHMYVYVFVKNLLLSGNGDGVTGFLLTAVISVILSFAYIAISKKKKKRSDT